MRPLEIAILVVVLLLAARWMIPMVWSRSRYWMIIAAGGLVLLGAHLWWEGNRWQMWLLYALLLILGGLTFLPIRPWRDLSLLRRTGRIIGLLLFALLLAVSITLPTVIPIPFLTPTTGPYTVGTISMTMTDGGRADIMNDDPFSPRRYVVQFWYPADDQPGAERAYLLPEADIVTKVLAERLGLGSFVLDHLTLLKTNADVGLPVAESLDENPNFPLLVFSHGYNSTRVQSTTLMEELASHGYIVASIDHTHGGVVTIFPDGEVVFLHPDALVGEERVLRHSAIRLGNIWRKDIEHLLSQLPSLTLSGEQADVAENLARRADIERLGVFGHSTGAGVTTVFCAIDSRCQAVVAMDSWMGPVPDYILDQGSERPVFFFMSETWPEPANVARIARYAESSTDVIWLDILGTGHYDFTDLPLLSPLTEQIGISGSIDSYRGQTIVHTYVRTFFDQALKEDSSTLFELPSGEFSEVRTVFKK